MQPYKSNAILWIHPSQWVNATQWILGTDRPMVSGMGSDGEGMVMEHGGDDGEEAMHGSDGGDEAERWWNLAMMVVRKQLWPNRRRAVSGIVVLGVAPKPAAVAL